MDFLDNDKDLNDSTTTTTSLTSRFSLILLEPGEIYFEDYLVYYYELNSPFVQDKRKKIQKGNLKICSKSFVFDPLNFSYPLIKFSYKSIEKIHLFNQDQNEESIYATKNDTLLNQKCFAISTKQTISCKANNKIGPYTIQKRDKQTDLHYFQFIFTDCSDSLDLLFQLHRASTLEYEQEDVMLQMILNSRLNRDKFKFDLHQLEDVIKEQIQLECNVNKISPLVANPGKIILTNMCIYYKPFNNLTDSASIQESNLFKIKLKQIKYVIKRRYHLKRVGLEIQFLDLSQIDSNLSYYQRLPYLYVTFYDEKSRDLFYNRLVVDHRDKLINFEDFSQENMLQKWRYGAISNYEYIMYLNNISDRSYNDLTQYPILPWVITDYTSHELDLNDPSIYRDLSKPIGALNQERLTRLKQRSKDMQAAGGDTPAFLYGSHYSTPAFVLYYLVRSQPEWQLCLQTGKFDQPNRLFHSIADTWKNCLSIDSDVKELIPEFYDTSSQPVFLRNYLELDLGVRQDGVRVNHVILPKWANNNPKEFVQKMRDALESPFVSDRLHEWIDLIWGYKQIGEEAVKADNLFYYLCYEGAIDLDSIKDYSERKSLEIQIQEFGQIPTQLFKQAHLSKSKQLELELVLNVVEENTKLEKQNSVPSQTHTQNPNRICPANFKYLNVKIQTKIHKSQVNDLIFLKQQDDKMPLVCSVSSDNWIKIFSIEDRSIFRSHNESNFSLSSVDFLQTNDDLYKSNLLFLSCWDNSIYVYDMNYNRCVYSLEDAHEDAISRIKLLQSSSSIYVLTSSWDSLIKIWRLNDNFTSTIKLQFISELTHDSSIINFEINESYLGSICDDGSLHLYKLNLIPGSECSDQTSIMSRIRLDNELDRDNCFSFLSVINPELEGYGKITDCKLLRSNVDSIDSVAVCTSTGYVKIYNIKTNSEIFSLKVTTVKLNKILYSHDYLLSCDSNGCLNCIDLQSQNGDSDFDANNKSRSRSNSLGQNNYFLSKTIKLSESSLDSIEIYNDTIVCVGDSDGNLHFLTLLEI